jgi:NAD(P)-dependent dehydrogenase (short-subunit alcohol dehydrogenase family)
MRSDDGMSMPAEDAVVIVTGGSLSIGREVAGEVASRDYAVVVVSRPPREATRSSSSARRDTSPAVPQSSACRALS